MKFERKFLIFFAFNYFIIHANCDCHFKVTTLTERRPIFKKHLGSNVVRIVDDSSETIKMYDGEKITGYCATKFNSIPNHMPQMSQIQGESQSKKLLRIAHLLNQRHISLYCGSGSLFTGISEKQHEINSSTIFSCEAVQWGIYESKRQFPWCGEETVSYILATIKFSPLDILGSLCFNLKSGILESIRYTTNNFQVKQDNQRLPFPMDISPDDVDIEVKLEDFQPHQDFENSKENILNSNNEFLKTASFKEYSLAQSVTGNEVFQYYSQIFKISWWENLFQTNWQRFLRAFKKQATEVSFDVYFGISGKLLVPEPKSCDGKETGETKLKEQEGKTPSYIWTYVRSLDNSDDFVFISYNSPFFEFLNSTEVIFCEDMCSEVKWLNKIRFTFRYSTLGISFCCAPESVKKSTMLRSFPNELKAYKTKLETTTSSPSTTTSEIIRELQHKNSIVGEIWSENDRSDEPDQY